MIGDSVLQQFFVEFAYNGGGIVLNNTMTLTVTDYSLPGTYIGNATFDYLKPVP